MKIDKTTIDGEFGHYARVLIEVDISIKPIDYLMIEKVGKRFSLKLPIRICHRFVLLVLYRAYLECV